MKHEISFESLSNDQAMPIIQEHLNSLSYPFEGYVEGMLDNSKKKGIFIKEALVGYAGISDDFIDFFFVSPPFYHLSQNILDALMSETHLYRVMARTYDTLLMAVLAEYTYTKDYYACFFIDAGRIPQPNVPVKTANFRLATLDDIQTIDAQSEGFFEDYQQFILDHHFFVLENPNGPLGYGLFSIEKYNDQTASIGMYCIRKHRKHGVAQTILWHLKEEVYAIGRSPVAGCWFYNTLSRRALESANLRAVGKGYVVNIEERVFLPKRTGNPPGELVED